MQTRTLASIIRTLCYGGSAGALVLGDPHTLESLKALLLGALAADYITWAVGVVVNMPEKLLHGSYDLLVNLLFVYFLYFLLERRTGVVLPPLEGEPLAMAALAFGAVAVGKIFLGGLRFAMEPVAEDGA